MLFNATLKFYWQYWIAKLLKTTSLSNLNKSYSKTQFYARLKSKTVSYWMTCSGSNIGLAVQNYYTHVLVNWEGKADVISLLSSLSCKTALTSYQWPPISHVKINSAHELSTASLSHVKKTALTSYQQPPISHWKSDNGLKQMNMVLT